MEKKITELAAQNRAAIYEKFNVAHEKAVSLIESYITGGYADTLARLLVYIGSERADSVLSRLPEATQKSVRDRYDTLLSSGPVLKKAGFYGKAMADTVTKELEDSIDGYEFRLPENSYQLCEIGTSLHNCVASYADDVKQKRCTIVYAVKDGDYRLCIEVRGKKIWQERSDHNAAPTEEERKALKEWHVRHGLVKA